MSDQWEGSNFSASPGWIDDLNAIHRKINEQADVNDAQGRLNDALVLHNRNQNKSIKWLTIGVFLLMFLYGLHGCATLAGNRTDDRQNQHIERLECRVYELQHQGTRCAKYGTSDIREFR
jgi:hypothetical protein